MKEAMLKTKSVKDLICYVESAELKRFIKNLPTYDIHTLYDLQTIQHSDMPQILGFGPKKIERLLFVQEVLNQNIDTITAEPVEENIPLPDDVRQAFSDIPLSYLKGYLEDKKMQGLVDSLLKNTSLQSLLDFYEMPIDTLASKPAFGNTKLSRARMLQTMIADVSVNIISAYKESTRCHLLPSSVEGLSIAQSIKKFIEEYIALAERVGYNGPTIPCVSLKYLSGCSDRMLIAAQCNIDQERVRQLTSSSLDKDNSFILQIRNIVNGVIERGSGVNFTLSEQFKTQLLDVMTFVKVNALKRDFLDKVKLKTVGANAEGVLNFLIDLCGVQICGGSQSTQLLINEEFLVDTKLSGLSDKTWSFVIKKLESVVKPYNKEELLRDIKEEWPKISDEIVDTIARIIESSKDQFVAKREGYMTTYQLSWKGLRSFQPRVERILFENGGRMQTQDIKVEYDRRAVIAGLKERKTSRISPTVNIMEYCEGGTWIWREFSDVKETLSIQEMVRRYAAEYQKFRKEAVMSHLQKFIPSVKERTVSALLSKYCDSTTEGYYVYKDSRQIFPELHDFTRSDVLPEVVEVMDKKERYAVDELLQLYTERYKRSIMSTKLMRLAKANPDIFIVEKGNRSKKAVIYLNPDWNGEYERRSLERGVQAEWRREVRKQAINVLRHTQNYEMEQVYLVKQMMRYLPSEIKHNNIYRLFQEDKIFIVRPKESGRGNIVRLNQEVWSKEFDTLLVTQPEQQTEDTVSASHKYDDKPEFARVQQQLLHTPLYHMNLDSDLVNLRAVVASTLKDNLYYIKKDNMELKDFDRAWNHMIEIMDVRSLENDEYYRMMNALYGYLLGYTSRNDQYYLYLELRLNFEPYLKKLFVRYIPDSYLIQNGKLKKLINECQSLRLLPPEGENCNLCVYIGDLINKRNYRGHNAERTPSPAFLAKHIQQLLTLYLYVSMQFLQNYRK